MALAPGAPRAVDALADLAHLLSSDDDLIAFLQSPVWVERYGLSDSIFLVADDPVAGSAAAAQFFFDLAYVKHQSDRLVLLRGGLAQGEALKVGPLFPESGSANGGSSIGVRTTRPSCSGCLRQTRRRRTAC